MRASATVFSISPDRPGFSLIWLCQYESVGSVDTERTLAQVLGDVDMEKADRFINSLGVGGRGEGKERLFRVALVANSYHVCRNVRPRA